MLKDGGRQPSNREERSLSASTVIARWQGNGWDEPCKLRGLRTVLWAAGGEIPPADPAAWNPGLLSFSYYQRLNINHRDIACLLHSSRHTSHHMCYVAHRVRFFVDHDILLGTS